MKNSQESQGVGDDASQAVLWSKTGKKGRRLHKELVHPMSIQLSHHIIYQNKKTKQNRVTTSLANNLNLVSIDHNII